MNLSPTCQGRMKLRRLLDAPQELFTATESIAGFVGPILAADRAGRRFAGRWPARGGWRLAHVDHEEDRG